MNLNVPREREWIVGDDHRYFSVIQCPARAGVDRIYFCSDHRDSAMSRASGSGSQYVKYCRWLKNNVPREREWIGDLGNSSLFHDQCPAQAGDQLIRDDVLERFTRVTKI